MPTTESELFQYIVCVFVFVRGGGGGGRFSIQWIKIFHKK